MAYDVHARLGTRFEVRAIHVGERLDVKGIEPRLGPQLPVAIEVGSTGIAVLVRAGAVVLFNVDPIQQERFIADLGARVVGRAERQETERAMVRVGDADTVEPDAIVLRELSIERLQVIAEILGKSVVLARYELDIAETFTSIEPMAKQMKTQPGRLPWKQRDLVRTIGDAILVEHELVDRAELLEKPDLLWDNAELDRLYARLEDEYELRERYLTLDTKLGVVSRAAQTMLELAQTKRSLHVEYYIIGLIAFEIVLAVFELIRH
ncbi:MAG TPA: RMD1 family protein [Kofleriaceae bacterium]